MAVWLQVGSLLFLLAFSAGGANAETLCGADLVEALYGVCGSSLFFNNPNPKREVDPLLEGELTKYPYKKRKPTVRRGIVEQCCFRSCSIFDLQNYCP